jgi:hypothetical protein
MRDLRSKYALSAAAAQQRNRSLSRLSTCLRLSVVLLLQILRFVETQYEPFDNVSNIADYILDFAITLSDAKAAAVSKAFAAYFAERGRAQSGALPELLIPDVGPDLSQLDAPVRCDGVAEPSADAPQ